MASKSRCFYSAAVISWQEKMTILHLSAWKQKQVFYTKPQCFTHAGWVVIVPKLKLEDKHSAEPKKDIENSILTNFKLQLEETFRCDFAEMYVGNIHSGNEHQERSRLYNHLIRHTDMKYRIVSGRSIQKMPTHCPPLMWQKELRVFLVSHRETPQIFFCIVKKKNLAREKHAALPSAHPLLYFLLSYRMNNVYSLDKPGDRYQFQIHLATIQSHAQIVRPQLKVQTDWSVTIKLSKRQHSKYKEQRLINFCCSPSLRLTLTTAEESERAAGASETPQSPSHFTWEQSVFIRDKQAEWRITSSPAAVEDGDSERRETTALMSPLNCLVMSL